MNNQRIYEIENAHIKYRNFSGEERMYNAKGKRNFNLVLNEEQANMFREDGFNVRMKQFDNGDTQYLLPVAVGFEIRPPKVVVIQNGHKTELHEDTVGELDYADIDYIDLTIRPYHWAQGGKTGVKAYLNSLYVTLVPDRFAEKYADDEESPF